MRPLRPHQRDVARVVAHPLLLLERRVVLLVHHHRAEPLDRREHRRAGSERDPRPPLAQPGPLVEPLAVGEPAVQDRHLVAEPRPEPRRQLRRQRDLRHQHQRPAPRRQRVGDDVQVHLRLPAPRDPVQQEALELARRHRRGDRPVRRLLRRGQDRRRNRSRHPLDVPRPPHPRIDPHHPLDHLDQPSLHQRPHMRARLRTEPGHLDLARAGDRLQHLPLRRRPLERRGWGLGVGGWGSGVRQVRFPVPCVLFPASCVFLWSRQPGHADRSIPHPCTTHLADIPHQPRSHQLVHSLPLPGGQLLERDRSARRLDPPQHLPGRARLRASLGSDRPGALRGQLDVRRRLDPCPGRQRGADHLAERRLVIARDPAAELDQLTGQRRLGVEQSLDLPHLPRLGRRRLALGHHQPGHPARAERHQHPPPEQRLGGGERRDPIVEGPVHR